MALDVLAGFTAEDPKTVAGIGQRPLGGYAAAIRPGALAGQAARPLWAWLAPCPALAGDARRCSAPACEGLQALGAELVEDPFAGSGFADLAHFITALPYDARGEESVAYDLDRYLSAFGPESPIHSLESLKRVTGVDPFDPAGSLGYLWELEDFPQLLANYRDPPASGPLPRHPGAVSADLRASDGGAPARCDCHAADTGRAAAAPCAGSDPRNRGVGDQHRRPAGHHCPGRALSLRRRLWSPLRRAALEAKARLISFAAEYEAIT